MLGVGVGSSVGNGVSSETDTTGPRIKTAITVAIGLESWLATQSPLVLAVARICNAAVAEEPDADLGPEWLWRACTWKQQRRRQQRLQRPQQPWQG